MLCRADTAAAAASEQARAYYDVANALEQAYVPCDHGCCRQGGLSRLGRPRGPHWQKLSGNTKLAPAKNWRGGTALCYAPAVTAGFLQHVCPFSWLWYSNVGAWVLSGLWQTAQFSVGSLGSTTAICMCCCLYACRPVRCRQDQPCRLQSWTHELAQDFCPTATCSTTSTMFLLSLLHAGG